MGTDQNYFFPEISLNLYVAHHEKTSQTVQKHFY